MDSVERAGQMVAYLDDVLTTYRMLQDDRDAYEDARNELWGVREDAQRRRRLLRGEKGFLWYLTACIPVLLLCAVLRALGAIPAWSIPVITPALAGLIFCGSRGLYERNALRYYLQGLQEVERATEDELLRLYERLKQEQGNLTEQTKGLDEDCATSIGIYVMRQAAHDGLCDSIRTGVNFFRFRYQKMVTSSDPSVAATVERLQEITKENREMKEFLAGLDGDVRRLEIGTSAAKTAQKGETTHGEAETTA